MSRGAVRALADLLTRCGFPFVPSPGRTPLRRLRHLCRREMFGSRPLWQRVALRAAVVPVWPVAALFATIRCLRALPVDERPTGVRGWFARAADMMRRALLDDVPPDAYAIYRLHEPGRAAFVADALFGPEPQWLAGRLARLAGADEADVGDKARFAVLCRRHGVPVVPTLAVYRGGAREGPDAPFSPDRAALWVKDLRGSRGAGAACWRRDGAGWRDAHGGPVLSEVDLEARWFRGDRLVQPVVIAHPVLAALSTGAAVPDVRIVTGIGRDGEVAVVGAQARLGAGGRPGRRQIFAAVGDDGRLGTALFAGRRPVERHPVTGADLRGVEVPFWPDAVALVRRSHATVPEFARFPFLGWDVAITAEGPLLIEANVSWDGLLLQAGDRPLGRTALPAIALGRLHGDGGVGAAFR